MPTDRPSARKRAALLIGGAVAVAAVVAAVVWTTTDPGTTTAAPAPAKTTAAPQAEITPMPTTAPVETGIAPEAADAALVGYFASLDGLSPETDAAAYESIARGTALSEIESQVAEFAANGWTLTGTPRVENVTVLAATPDGTPPAATVQACVDSSDVVVRRADGEPAFTADPTSVRALNIFGLEFIDGSWRLVSHTFPDQADC